MTGTTGTTDATGTTSRTTIVSGHDDTPTADSALDWAHRTAASWRADLVVVHACDGADHGGRGPLAGGQDDRSEVRAHIADRLTALSAADGPEVSTRVLMVRGPAAESLVTAATGAELLVLGRGRHHVTLPWSLGSVANHVIRTSAGPVAVVPANWSAGTTDASVGTARGAYVLVGWDGSEQAVEALRWAAGHAVRVELPLRILLGWRYSTLLATTAHGRPGIPSMPEFEATAAVLLAEARRIARDQEPGLEVTVDAVHRPPAAALGEACGQAAVLVLGTRRLAGLERVALGSTSAALTRHASCPVVVVPGHTVEVQPPAGRDAVLGSALPAP